MRETLSHDPAPACCRRRITFLTGHGVWPALLGLTLLMTGCASQHGRSGDAIPPDIARIPDAVPKVEPLSKSGNPDSYVVFGKRYYTEKDSRGHVERGLASWYGKPFHGRKTSSGEIYDMHAMSAAHKTLPLPTYARVTNLENGRSVVVRINDRGPFHGPRIIDLSYTAAVKLGVVKHGTAKVEVRAIDPRHRRSDAGPFLAGTGSTRSSNAKATPARRVRPAQSAGRGEQEQPPVQRATTALASSRLRPVEAQSTGHPGRTFYLQVGAFGDQKNAERLRERLSRLVARNEVKVLAPNGSGTPLYKVRVGPLGSERDAARVSQEIAGLGVGSPHRVWN